MNEVADSILQALGLEGMALMITLIVISMICNVIGRVIPDDATGWKGIVRKIASVIGLHVSNRISSGVTVTAVTRAVLPELQKVTQQDPFEYPSEQLEVKTKPLFPGFNPDRDGI